MIKVKANIKLYKDGRKTSFHSGYRPMFSFLEEMKISGKINLVDRIEFCPGEEGEVEINFINKKYLGDDFDIGKKFTFGEGEEPLGEGEITEVF
jgi:elongation factor Tu